jgi:sortase A
MKKLSWILIISGLLIAAYPLLDKAYSIYLQTKLVMDWDVDLENAYTPEEAAEDYEQLQSVFEDGLIGEAEAGAEEESIVVEPTSQPVQTEIPVDTSTPEPVPTESAQPEPSQETTAKPAKQQQFKAIGRIQIDKIGLSIPILEGTSKANLRLGAGHIKGTTGLGDIGNAALAAHRSHTYGRMFNRLDELELGDKIVVETADGTYEYTVFKKLVVEPNDTSVLNRNNKDRVLTLVTCTPLYTATHRLIVHAVIRS